MAVKDWAIYVLPSTLQSSGSSDFFGWVNGWAVALTDATDLRVAWSQFHPNVQRINVSPAGVAYPGDAVPGNGPIKLTINYQGVIPDIVMNRVDDITLENGWLLINKGDHVIGLTASKIFNIVTQPSDP